MPRMIVLVLKTGFTRPEVCSTGNVAAVVAWVRFVHKHLPPRPICPWQATAYTPHSEMVQYDQSTQTARGQNYIPIFQLHSMRVLWENPVYTVALFMTSGLFNQSAQGSSTTTLVSDILYFQFHSQHLVPYLRQALCHISGFLARR